ncbi:MAG: hypothetical protein KDC88_04595 [Ignavibacteriae bacterium]|nr:hypothetical protein [Ignavibacteriota bacterium]
MIKIFGYLILLSFVLSCSQNKKDLNNSQKLDKQIEHKSIHQKEYEKYSEKSENYIIEILESKAITDSSVGKFQNPKFSNDGRSLFFSTNDFNQIWIYNFYDNSYEKIIDLPQCGNGFQISDNGKEIYFRNRAMQGKKRGGIYSIVNYSLENKKLNVIYKTENRISIPILIKENLYFLENDEPKNLNLQNGKINQNFEIPFYFVENNILIKQTSRKDTISYSNKNFKFVNIRYTTDKKNIICLTANNGILIFDINAKPINVYPNANFLNKLLNSNLVIYSEEKDDGVQIIESKFKVGFINSNIILNIETNPADKCYKPDWSPIDNTIVYSNQSGIIKTIKFNIKTK